MGNISCHFDSETKYLRDVFGAGSEKPRVT